MPHFMLSRPPPPAQVPELQLPIRFDTDVGGELPDSVQGVGRSLSVSFNRCMAPASPEQVRISEGWDGFLMLCGQYYIRVAGCVCVYVCVRVLRVGHSLSVSIVT